MRSPQEGGRCVATHSLHNAESFKFGSGSAPRGFPIYVGLALGSASEVEGILKQSEQQFNMPSAARGGVDGYPVATDSHRRSAIGLQSERQEWRDWNWGMGRIGKQACRRAAKRGPDLKVQLVCECEADLNVQSLSSKQI